jgi:hypothetical protein
MSCTILLFYEAETLWPSNRCQRLLDDREKRLQVQGITQPGIVGTTQLENLQEVVDLGRVGLDFDNLPVCPDESELHASAR